MMAKSTSVEENAEQGEKQSMWYLESGCSRHMKEIRPNLSISLTEEATVSHMVTITRVKSLELVKSKHLRLM